MCINKNDCIESKSQEEYIVISSSDSQEVQRNLIEEKKSFAQKSTGYQRTGGHLSEDESYRERSNLNTSDLQSDPSSSNSGTCPHCKIHSWLPHSADCPNSQHNIKRPSTSMALYRK